MCHVFSILLSFSGHSLLTLQKNSPHQVKCHKIIMIYVMYPVVSTLLFNNAEQVWKFTSLAFKFVRANKQKANVLAGDVVSVCHQPVKLLLSLFARTSSLSGKPALHYPSFCGHS